MKNTKNQLTIMLLLVTTLFLILMIPTQVRYLYTSFVKRDTPVKYAILLLLYHISQALYFTNNGVNFFLYCVSGTKFWNDLKDLLGYNRGLISSNSFSSIKENMKSSVTDLSNM